MELTLFIQIYIEEESIPLHSYLVLGLDGLVKETNFNREEIQRMYRGFKQVSLATF